MQVCVYMSTLLNTGLVDKTLKRPGRDRACGRSVVGGRWEGGVWGEGGGREE